MRTMRTMPPVSLTIGRRSDPYPLAESTQGRTRTLLEALLPHRPGLPRLSHLPHLPHLPIIPDGLEISILTRSPLLLRDLELLVDLDRRHAVSVGVVIPAADPRLARRCEPRLPPAASPEDRLDMVRTLAAHGIAARVVCTPIQPGLNNSAAAIGRLLELARQAGASDVLPAPRHPALPPTPFEAQHLLALFGRLRLEHGFPRTLPGRG